MYVLHRGGGPPNGILDQKKDLQMRPGEAFEHSIGPLIAQMKTFPKHSDHGRMANRSILARFSQAQEASSLERPSLTYRKHKHPAQKDGR